MELIKKGAEAELYKIMYKNRPAVLKRRIPKRYRVPELDEHIRKTRTRREARLLERARRSGVLAPEVYHVDDKKMEIVMEYVSGERAKEYLLRTGDAGLMRKIGELIAILHENNIVHGDLTTSNIILSGKDIYFIDFGLGSVSTSIEDKAVDLVCFEKSFIATHSDIAEEGWNALVDGYGRYSEAPLIWKRFEEVKRRARYL
ncbi:MAG: regulating kinase and related kinase [Candidatus Diapherotrites archaeon]|nr:regulating kinase and related kinase [Candidatus Diapherotrites archaeon]MDN5367007.1 regulating kinase and related kinase [Candidatus Diapherotrites archaeon]